MSLHSFSRQVVLGVGLTVYDAQKVRLPHDHELLAVELDLGPGPLAKEHPIANLDVQRMDPAILGTGARSRGDDLTFHRHFLGRVGDDDAAGGLLLLLDTTDQNTVLQRTEFHEPISPHQIGAVGPEPTVRTTDIQLRWRAWLKDLIAFND